MRTLSRNASCSLTILLLTPFASFYSYHHLFSSLLSWQIVFDCSDRLPLIWPNQGNAGNLIVSRTAQGLKVRKHCPASVSVAFSLATCL